MHTTMDNYKAFRRGKNVNSFIKNGRGGVVEAAAKEGKEEEER
jgi:hypothetical protein